jgi:hypothetical protein
MLRKVVAVNLVLLTLSCFGCKRRPALDPDTALTGTWSMIFGSDCKDYGLKSDTLVLRPDGTLDQLVVAQDGRRFESVGQHWEFSAPSSIQLNQRRNFFARQNYKELVGVPEFEVLIVKFDSPPTILIHPDSDCFYTKTK